MDEEQADLKGRKKKRIEGVNGGERQMKVAWEEKCA